MAILPAASQNGNGAFHPGDRIRLKNNPSWISQIVASRGRGYFECRHPRDGYDTFNELEIELTSEPLSNRKSESKSIPTPAPTGAYRVGDWVHVVDDGSVGRVVGFSPNGLNRVKNTHGVSAVYGDDELTPTTAPEDMGEAATIDPAPPAAKKRPDPIIKPTPAPKPKPAATKFKAGDPVNFKWEARTTDGDHARPQSGHQRKPSQPSPPVRCGTSYYPVHSAERITRSPAQYAPVMDWDATGWRCS